MDDRDHAEEAEGKPNSTELEELIQYANFRLQTEGSTPFDEATDFSTWKDQYYGKDLAFIIHSKKAASKTASSSKWPQ